MSQCCKVPKTFGHFELKQESIAESQRKPHVSFFQPGSIMENDLSNNLNSNRLQLPICGGNSNFLNYNPYNVLDNIFHFENGCQLGVDNYSNYDYECNQKLKSQNQQQLQQQQYQQYQQQQQQQQYFNLMATNFNSNLNVPEEVSNNLFELRNINKNQIEILPTNSKEPIFKEQIPKEDKILQELKQQENIEVPCQKDAFSLEHIRLLSKKTLNNKELFQQIIPLLGILEEEPRYVNSRQYHRMMIMRIKRAKKATMLQKVQNEKINQYQQYPYPTLIVSEKNISNSNHYEESNFINSESSGARTYKYESRHKHAMNRQRGPDGRFESQKKQNQNEINKGIKKIKKQNCFHQPEEQQTVQVKEEVK